MTSNFRTPFKLLLCTTLAAPAFALACSSCGCTLSSDWESQGLSTTPGLRMDFRFDYINQNQLRHGRGSASKSDLANAIASGSIANPMEAEQYTRNRYYTLGLDYTYNRAWGVNVQLPYVDRAHGTIQMPPDEVSTSRTKSLGDVKIIGRYQGFSEAADTGVLFGAKLPTGSRDNNFTGGPASLAAPPDNALDRSLQPGTGSTDLILGVYHFEPLNKNWDWFVQGLVQTALRTRDGFRPGDSLNVNLGLRYLEFESVVPQIQINARAVRHDTDNGNGSADPANSGGQLAYLSPGVTVALSKTAKVYGFLQLPLYQNVNGYQLAPRWSASIGANIGF